MVDLMDNSIIDVDRGERLANEAIGIDSWGSLQEGTKFPGTPLQPFARLGCSQ